MHPEPTPGQLEMMGSVRDFLAKEVTLERLTRWEHEPDAARRELLEPIAELGWLGFGTPADGGGKGGGEGEDEGADFVDACLLFQEWGHGLLPLQLINAARGVHALAELDPENDLLEELVAGRAVIALAFDEEWSRTPEHYSTWIRDGRIEGTKCYVPNAESAEYHLVAAREGDGLSLALVENRDLRIEPLRGMADDSQAHVHYEGASILGRIGEPERARATFERMWLRQRLLALAEMVGGMDWVLDTTVSYAQERWQFDQPIGLFQAVRHQAADMATALTASRHLAYQAITRSVAGTIESTEIESALAYVGQAFKRVCWAGHHLHGGAAYVLDHPMHWHSERAQSYCIRYTPEAPILQQIAARLLDGGKAASAL